MMTAIHSAPSTDPVFRLPPDWEMQMVQTPFSEVYDWSLNVYGVPDLWKQNGGSINGNSIKVCVCDTGVQDDHPDLEGQIFGAKDFTNSAFGYKDRQGHGTWCSGMIVGKAGNDTGIAGIANKGKCFHSKVLGDNGAGSERSIIFGIQEGRKNGCNFFSLSLGGGQMSEQIHGLLRELVQEGCFFFMAAGNDAGPVNYPAKWFDICIPVGSSDKNGKLSRFTSRGPELLKGIVGPGEDMLSTVPGNRYATMSGTSMATPFACGIGMLAYGKHQEQGGKTDLNTLEDMREHLQRGAGKAGEYALINPAEIMKEEVNQQPGEGEQKPLFALEIYSPARTSDALRWGETISLNFK